METEGRGGALARGAHLWLPCPLDGPAEPTRARGHVRVCARVGTCACACVWGHVCVHVGTCVRTHVCVRALSLLCQQENLYSCVNLREPLPVFPGGRESGGGDETVNDRRGVGAAPCVPHALEGIGPGWGRACWGAGAMAASGWSRSAKSFRTRHGAACGVAHAAPARAVCPRIHPKRASRRRGRLSAQPPSTEQEGGRNQASPLPDPDPLSDRPVRPVPALAKGFLSQRPARPTPVVFPGPWALDPHPGVWAAGHSQLPVPSTSAVGRVPWARGQGGEGTRRRGQCPPSLPRGRVRGGGARGQGPRGLRILVLGAWWLQGVPGHFTLVL